MVDARQAFRQLHALDRFVALEGSGGYETRAGRHHKTRLDGLVGGDKDRVDPQTAFRPVLLVEHDARAVERRTIDALERLGQHNIRQILAALECTVADTDHRVRVLTHYDGLRDEQLAAYARVESHFRSHMVLVDRVVDVLILRVLRVSAERSYRKRYKQRCLPEYRVGHFE